MRSVKTFVITNTPVDRSGSKIAFALDPDTGTSYFINAQITEQFCFDEWSHGATFQGYATEPVPERGDKGGRILYVLPNSIVRPERAAQPEAGGEPIIEEVGVPDEEVEELLRNLRAAANTATHAALQAREAAQAAMQKAEAAAEAALAALKEIDAELATFLDDEDGEDD